MVMRIDLIISCEESPGSRRSFQKSGFPRPEGEVEALKVETSSGPVMLVLVVGADGVISRVSRPLASQAGKLMNAIETELSRRS